VMTGVLPATKGAGDTIDPQSFLSDCAMHLSSPATSQPLHDDTSCIDEGPKMAPNLCEASNGPIITFILPITGPVVVATSDHNVVTSAIAAQKYQELSLRLQKEYYQSSSKSLVNCPF